MSRAWFGGDWAAIVGECACPGGMFFNDNEMQARVLNISINNTVLYTVACPEFECLDVKCLKMSFWLKSIVFDSF